MRILISIPGHLQVILTWIFLSPTRSYCLTAVGCRHTFSHFHV